MPKTGLTIAVIMYSNLGTALSDAMRYICRTGCQWRSLPTCCPPCSAVYYYFRRWQLTGLWQQLNDAVVQADRLAAQRPAMPSLVCRDSQSVRLAPRIHEHRGLDGGKRVNGRKRQIITAVTKAIAGALLGTWPSSRPVMVGQSQQHFATASGVPLPSPISFEVG